MKAGVLVLGLLVLLVGFATSLRGDDSSLQNATYVIPATDNPASADPVIVANQDYFSVFVDGICINKNETFWRKNVINVLATLEVNGSAVSVPVYSGRATNTNCRIAVSNFGVLNSIPAKHSVISNCA